MKKMLLLLLCISLSLTLGCAAEQGEEPIDVPNNTEENTSSTATEKNEEPCFAMFRVVSGAETGQLVLTEHGGAATGVCTMSVEQMGFNPQIAEQLRNGQLINISFESVMESYPARFSEVFQVEIVEGGFDDRAALYLQVLEDLWQVDSGLNGGVEVIGVDLSQTSLTPAEQAAVAWIFAGNHAAQSVEGTLEELMEQGWIAAHPLTTSGSGTGVDEPKHYFYEWENGCHFSIVEQPMEGTYSLLPVTFDAQKWRSSLGAYFFSNCTALQSALGEWSDYHVGSEMIS